MSGLIDITHLNLSTNSLGDSGLDRLAPAIGMNKSLVFVDLSQNSFTPKCAYSVAQILTQNDTIVDLNLGSIIGANRNRIGQEGGLAIAYGIS